jgi:hypothetical protein
MVHVLGKPAGSKEVERIRKEIPGSPRVQALLARRDSDGRLQSGGNVYAKWQGAHWVLATLADIGYPAGDRSLNPIRDQVLEHWLGERFYKEFEATTKAGAYGKDGVPMMQGRHRRCASQQGNALYFLTRLGLADGRAGRQGRDADPPASCGLRGLGRDGEEQNE